MRRHWKYVVGYAARSVLKKPRERAVRFSPKSASPTISASQWTAARSEKNWPAASRKVLTLCAIDADANGLIAIRQAYGPRSRPRRSDRRPAGQRAHRDQRGAEHQRDEQQQRRVAARPADAEPLAEP